jgi:hypothetical protein
MHSGFSAPRPARSPALALTSGNVRKTTSTGSPPFGATAWRRTEDLIFSAREAWSMPCMRRSPPGFLPMTCNWMKYRPPIVRRSCPARIAGVDRSRQAGTRRDRRAGRRVLSRTRRDCFDLARNRVSRSWGRRVAPGSRIDSFVSRNTSATLAEYRQTKPGSWAPHARLPQSLMAHDVRDFRRLPFRCGRGDLASCVRRNHGSSSGAERAIRGGILAGIVLAQMARR